MNARDDESMRDTLREYLLGTLSEERIREVEDRLVDDAAWAAALEEEREALDLLDALVDDAVPAGLSRKVLDRLDEEAPKRIPSRVQLFQMVITAALVLFAVSVVYLAQEKSRGAMRDQQAASNLKQIGLSLKMYSNESKGERLPPLAPYEDLWIFDVSVLYPEYLPDITVLVSPNLSNYKDRIREIEGLVAEDPIDWERVSRITAESYTYLSWVVRDADDIQKLAEERSQLAKAEYDVDLDQEDLPFFRLREGIERFLITDVNNPGATARSQSIVPVVFDVAELEKSGEDSKIQVLYLDGHVVEGEGKSPLSTFRAIAEALSNLVN